MPVNKTISEINSEYAKKNYDLLIFLTRKDAQINGDVIHTHAAAAGESLNGFLKRAVEETIALDNESSDLPAQIQREIEGVELPQKTSRYEKVTEYNKKNYDLIKARVRKDADVNTESVKNHAKLCGESINAFLIRAIEETIQLDKENFSTCQTKFEKTWNKFKGDANGAIYGELKMFIRKDADINGDVIRTHATAMGESLNGFLNRAIIGTIQRDIERPLPVQKEESLSKPTRTQTVKEFNKKIYDRIALKVRKDAQINGDVIKDHALLRGETLGGFIKRAVEETFKRDLKQRRQDF